MDPQPMNDVTAPPIPSGLFVTFEGGEGGGKTTQVERAAGFLRELGREVVVTREPGGSPAANALRHILLSGEAQALGAEMEAILFAAARADHVVTTIEPALRRGADVLCDRFLDSTRVYQGLAGVDPALLTLLEDATIDGVRPALTILLDIPAREGLARATRRRGGGGIDRFEREAVEVHERRRARFVEIARAEPERCRIVDASRDENEVAAQIEAILRERIETDEPEAGSAA